MIKKRKIASSNVSREVSFALKGATKRRSMALSCARTINSDLGVTKRLVAIK